jgi:hypothetical protein
MLGRRAPTRQQPQPIALARHPAPVGLLTNATSRPPADLRTLRLADAFDVTSVQQLERDLASAGIG